LDSSERARLSRTPATARRPRVHGVGPGLSRLPARRVVRARGAAVKRLAMNSATPFRERRCTRCRLRKKLGQVRVVFAEARAKSFSRSVICRMCEQKERNEILAVSRAEAMAKRSAGRIARIEAERTIRVRTCTKCKLEQIRSAFYVKTRGYLDLVCKA